ncbi:MAG: hypothetical protein HY821_09790 [Acidobacteria bacterium]|nr:hypothetical protein [Acidobacteriota bacterium]
MRGPHGMHPVGDANWINQHEEVFEDSRTPAGNCQACHGTSLQGTPLARMAVTRTMECKETNNLGCKATSSGKRITLAAGTQVSCNLCHPKPGRG